MMESGKPVTVEAAASEVERELSVRVRCFDRWVQDGKMTRIDAQDRLDRMAAAFRVVTAAQKKLGNEHIVGQTDDIPF